MESPGRLTLALILFSATLTVMAGAVIAPVLNLMRDALGVHQGAVGFIITTHALFLALSSPFVGSLIDRVGTRKPFILGLVSYGLVGGAGLLVDSYWPLIVTRALLGVTVAAILTSITVMILNLYHGEDRNRVMGWRGSANSFGGILWPMVGGVLGRISWQLPFGIYLIGIPLGMMALKWVPETRPETHHPGGGTSVIRLIRENPVIIAIYGLMFVGAAFLYVNIIFMPQLLELIGLTDTLTISLFISVMTFMAGLVSLVYARIRGALSYVSIILATFILWAVGFAAISMNPSAVVIAISVALYGVGQGMVFPTAMLWLGDVTPSRFRGRIVSYLGTFGFIGMFFSPILFGPVALSLGITGVFKVCTGLCTLFGLTLILKEIKG